MWKAAISSSYSTRFEATSLRGPTRASPIIHRGPRLHFFRAPTDNDIHIGREWVKAGLDKLQQRITRVQMDQTRPSITTIQVDAILASYMLTPAFSVVYYYYIYGSGDILVRAHLKPLRDLPVLARVGLQIYLPGDLDHFSYYGRGPHENYVDRKESALVGVYSGLVKDQAVPYIFPQDTGVRSDVRWAALTDIRGQGLLAASLARFRYAFVECLGNPVHNRRPHPCPAYL